MGDAKLDDPSSEVAAVLSEAADLLDEAAVLLDGFSDEAKDGRQPLYRADSAVASGRALIALADPRVTPQALANEVRTNAQALHDNVQVAASDGGGGDIAGSVEPLLSSLVQLRQPAALVEEKAKEAARRYSQSLAPQMRAVKGEVERLEAQLAEVKTSAEGEAASVSERLDGIKGEMEAAAARVGELISDQDTKFTEAQEKRREEHASAISEAGHRLSEAQAAFDKRRDEAVARLDEIEEEIAETAAALGGSAAGVGHGAEYARQKKLAFRWSLATIGLLLAAAIVPTALGILEADQSPESVVGKITVALIIAGVAGYAGGLAHHHRERAATARRLEIEMNAFGPFIATLNPEDRNDLRSTVVWRFFGPDGAAQESDSDPQPGPRIIELLRIRRKNRSARASQETEE